MKTENRTALKGIFPPVVTPFVQDEVDLTGLRKNLRSLGKTRVSGYLALGSNGEFRSLSEDESTKIMELFGEEKGDKILMVGTGSDSTRLTIDACKRAAAFGADYASLITPSYFAKLMNDQVMRDYYTAVAEASPIPVIIYNIPGFAGGVQISPGVVAELASHPNIVGMKDSSAAGPARYLSVLDTTTDFAVLSGSTNTFYPALHLGASGGILSLANIVPGPCVDLYNLFTEGHYEDARSLHTALMRLNGAVSGKWGVAGVKAAMSLAGFTGGTPRHPLTPISVDATQDIARAFKAEKIPLQGATA